MDKSNCQKKVMVNEKVENVENKRTERSKERGKKSKKLEQNSYL